MPDRPVLFCGGSADGRWLNVPDAAHAYRVYVPPPVQIDITAADSDPTRIPQFPIEEYDIEPLYLFGHTLYVATLRGIYGRERDRAVIRAVFQRDVAQRVLT